MKTATVIGLGWMGLPIAALLSKGGYKTFGLDVNQELVDKINSKHIDRHEPGLKEILYPKIDSGAFNATTDSNVLSESDLIVTIVPLITNDDKSIDYSVIKKALRTVSEKMKENTLIVIHTTMSIGSIRKEVKPILDESGKKYFLGYSPIRGMAGTAIFDMEEKYPRIVGGLDEESVLKTKEMIKTFFKNKIIEMNSLEEAEAVKIMEVVYRDVNIALANELAVICESMKLDYSKIKEAANTCGYYHLHDAGIGVGGHCVPVYPYLILNLTDKDLGLMRKAREVNDFMPKHVSDTIRKLNPKTVTVYGFSYLKDSSETRFTPAINLIERLKEFSEVRVCDPNVPKEELEQYAPVIGLNEGLGSDVIVLTVNHSAFDELNLDGKTVVAPSWVRPDLDCIRIGKGV